MKTSATCNQTRVMHQLINSWSVADTCGRYVADKVSATRYITKENRLVSICKAIRQFWYPDGETAVSIHRNCRFLPWKRSFPTVETTVSNTGNSSSPPGNWSLMHLINFRTHRKQVYVWIIQCGRYSICNASATGICNATTSCKLIYYTRFVAGGRYFNVFSTLWRKEYITIMLITVKQLDEALSHPLLS